MNPLIIVVAAAALFGWGSGLKMPSFFKKQPPTQQLVIAQSELEAAKAAQAAAEAKLAALNAEAAAKTKEQIRYAQQTNEGVVTALDRVAAEHRTAEVVLAGDLARRTTVSLAAAVGDLPPQQRAEILKIVDLALSKVEAERDAAKAALVEKDRILQGTIQEKELLARELPKLQASVQAKTAEVLAKEAVVQTTTAQVRVYAEKSAEAEKRAGSLDAWAGSLVRWGILAGILYLLVHFALPCLAQEFPGARLLGKINQTAKSLSSAHL